MSSRIRRRFLSGCHRGYEKAQLRIVRMLEELGRDESLDPTEREFRELLLRKVVDGIAVVMLRTETHVIRRYSTGYEIPRRDMPTIRKALCDANALNKESRLTFALVADLTTFIHVTDLLRVDFRGERPTVSLIELKTGRVNEMLLDRLEGYQPSEENLSSVESDSSIGPQFKKQAKRMLKQRIRVEQIEEVLRTDKGTDSIHDMPIHLSKDMVFTEHYDPLVAKVLASAADGGIGCGVVGGCIHIGAGRARDGREVRRLALQGVQHAVKRHMAEAPPELRDVHEEVEFVPEKERFRLIDMVYSNLHTVPCCRPLVLWRIPREYLGLIVNREVCLLAAFDVASFIWMARGVGIDMGFSTRKQGAQAAQMLGSLVVPRWGGRALRYTAKEGEVTVCSGLLARFINELVHPIQFLADTQRVDEGGGGFQFAEDT